MSTENFKKMPINFPNTGLVANVTTYTYGSKTWMWNGSAWDAVSSVQAPQGAQGIQGGQGTTGNTGAQGPTGSQGIIGRI